MRNAFVLFSLIFLHSFLASAQRSNCNVSPYPNTFTQPNGKVITLYAYGNEAINYVETEQGYTVLRNSDGNYEYAIIAPDGNLTLSGMSASNDQQLAGKTGIQQHLRYSPAQADVLMQAFEKMHAVNMGKTGPNVFPPQGDRKILVLLVQYPDLPATVSTSDFELLFNQPNYNGTGSFRDYYQKTSFGKLNLTCDVYGWYTAANGYQYYGNTSGNWGATQELLQGAILSADSAGVDFSQYDSDSDGYVDAVMLLHSGIGAEEASAPNSGNYIWSFRSTLWSGSPLVDGKQIWAYAMFPEKRYSTNSMVGIGVMSHEFGHILDLPDLYNTNANSGAGGSEGVGNFANMAGGPWLNNERTPCMHDAWSKIQLGWLTPQVLTEKGEYTIPKSAVDSNFVYRINTPRTDEYFLLENKQKKGQDLYIPGKGLAIWHINTRKAGTLSQKSNGGNNDTADMAVGLLEADGKRHLELGTNRGDAGDLFPGSTNNSNATPNTKPSTALYNKVNGVNQTSGIFIQNITVNPDSSITFRFGASPTASCTPSGVTGCVPYSVTLSNTSTFATNYKWSFGDGNFSANKDENHIFTNPGTYDVWLTVWDSVTQYIDSIKKTITVYSTPEAVFSLSRTNNTISFTNSSTNAAYYQWKFGSFSSFSTTPQPLNLKSLQDSGTIKITLIAFSNGGCSDTAETTLEILNTGIFETAADNFNANLYPNPVKSNSVLSFNLTKTGKVAIEVYSILGERVTVIEDRELQSGQHTYNLPKEILPSKGVYIVRISSDSQRGYIRLLNE